MSIVKRSVLEGYFANGSVPTASNFTDFIESTVNMANDGITVNAARQFGLGTSSPGATLAVQPQTAVPLSGTVSVTTGSPTVQGSADARFQAELAPGDAIKIDGQVYSVQAIASNTSLTLSGNATSSQSGISAYRDGNGFSISSGLGQPSLVVDQAGNMGLGLGGGSPTERLDVGGTVKATGFVGSGASLTGLTAGQITGAFNASQIPDIPASKLTGQIAASQITGTFNVGQIPSLQERQVFFYTETPNITDTNAVDLKWLADPAYELELTYILDGQLVTRTFPSGYAPSGYGKYTVPQIYNDTLFSLTMRAEGQIKYQRQVYVSVHLTPVKYATLQKAAGTSLTDAAKGVFEQFNYNPTDLKMIKSLGQALAAAGYPCAGNPSVFGAVANLYILRSGISMLSAKQITALTAGIDKGLGSV
jgi:sorbitol-specific phosphotransferase system component IIA